MSVDFKNQHIKLPYEMYVKRPQSLDIPEAPIVGLEARPGLIPDLIVISRIDDLFALHESGVELGQVDIFHRVVKDPKTNLLALGTYKLDFSCPNFRESLIRIRQTLDRAKLDNNRQRVPQFLDFLASGYILAVPGEK